MQQKIQQIQPIKRKPLEEDFRHRHGTDKEQIQAEAGVGIMKHKDGTIEKRKF